MYLFHACHVFKQLEKLRGHSLLLIPNRPDMRRDQTGILEFTLHVLHSPWYESHVIVPKVGSLMYIFSFKSFSQFICGDCVLTVEGKFAATHKCADECCGTNSSCTACLPFLLFSANGSRRKKEEKEENAHSLRVMAVSPWRPYGFMMQDTDLVHFTTTVSTFHKSVQKEDKSRHNLHC